MTERPRIKVGGVLRFRDLCLVGVMSAPDRPGLAAAIFSSLGQAQLNCQFIVQSIDLNDDSHVQFCVSQEDRAAVLKLLEPIRQQLGAKKVIARWPVAVLGVFGPDFRERPGIAGVAFHALGKVGVNILAVSTSISTISCVIEEEGYEAAMEAFQSVFALP